MIMKRILYIALLATSIIALCASAAAPKKKFVYDGLILSTAKEHVLDWDKLAADKKVTYVYFEIPFPVCDTAILKKNVQQAREHGLKTGVCYSFTDSLQNVIDILDHLLTIPTDVSQIAPMISIPEGRTFERRALHRCIQIWANVLKKHFGEQPVLKATRENCKDYLAPVLTSTYRICLVFTDPCGSYMLQNPDPYPTPDPDLVAYPCRVMPE